jgi:hypothetical protein
MFDLNPGVCTDRIATLTTVSLGIVRQGVNQGGRSSPIQCNYVEIKRPETAR